MNRLAVVALALVLASCSKAKKDAAPATSAEPPRSEPTGGRGDGDQGRDPKTALEHARNQGGLGVSGHTTAFEPLEGSGSAKGGPSTDPAKPDPKEDARKIGGTQGVVAPMAAAGFTATIDAVTIDGKPAPADITQAVKVTSSDIQVCYDKAREKNPKAKDLTGTLKIAFTILKTGAVFNAAIEGKALGEFELENCVMGALSKMKLAKPPADKISAVATITFAKK